jgi:hypothetical protein
MTRMRARNATNSSTRSYETATLALAGLVALAIWLPLPLGDDALTQRREAKFIAKGDPAASTSHLSARPLLDPARKSVSADTTKPKASPLNGRDLTERYTLRGLARVDNTDVAVFEDKTTKRSVRLQRGQTLGDWYLAEVQGEQAILKNADGAQRPITLTAKPN